jgi:hypothetical protein
VKSADRGVDVDQIIYATIPPKPPPLRRIHDDASYERDPIARRSLAYHRAKTTDEIVDSLRPGAAEPLIVKSDGRIFQGNTRIKVLQERGFPVDALPREIMNDVSPQVSKP